VTTPERFATTGASADVRGSRLRYVEVGDGPPVLFLHGNPTSSYLWRNVLGPVARHGFRCIALDLIGMGGSGKPAIGYRLADHVAFLDAFLDAMELPPTVVVGHDWGAVLAVDLLSRRPDQVRALAFMEGHLHPIDRWSDMDPGGRELFGALRTPGVGERMVLGDNMFVEQVLPSGMAHHLTDEEWAAYRAPFLRPADRLPILSWVREIPIEGEPADVADLVARNQRVLVSASVPTLLLHGTPGAVVGAAEVRWCRTHCPAMAIADIGPGTHFLPEDRPDEIVAALVGWLPRTGA
jgi:haloalkane dehalogenase